MKAETCMVANQNESDASLRFFAQGTVNNVGEQAHITMSWPKIRDMIARLQSIDPEMLGKPRNLD